MFCMSWFVGKYLHQCVLGVVTKVTECSSQEPIVCSEVKELYRSGNFIVIDKDFDVRINSDDPAHVVTVETQLKAQFPSLGDSRLGHSFRFVHRLDHATSGVLCVALTRASARQASKMFQDRRVVKHYLALVRGHVSGWPGDVCEVDLPIGRDLRETDTHKYCTSDQEYCAEARSANTRMVVLEYGQYEGRAATKLLLIPHTGRSHQLRVHCAHTGHVIVGDYIYSNSMDNAPHRMMLHAFRLVVPMRDEALDICSEDPFLPHTDPKWQPTQQIQTYEGYLSDR